MKKNDNNANSPEFSRNREFSVILESIEDKISLLAEGQAQIRLDGKDVRETQGRMWEKMTLLEMTVNRRFDSVEKRLDRLESALT